MSYSPVQNVFVMSPVFSPYQTLESFIVQLSVQNACQQVNETLSFSTDKPNVTNLMNNTPYLLYQLYGLYNPSRALVLNIPGGTPLYPTMSFGQQQLYLIIAFMSVSLYEAISSDLVFINGNGPVVNSGFTAILGVLNTLGKQVTYWKDDSRHLWGFNDNPLSIGLMNNINRQLIEPPRLDIRLTNFSITSGNIKCSNSTLNDRISNTLKSYSSVSPGSMSSIIQQKYKLGEQISNAVGGNFLPSNIRSDNIKTMGDLFKIIVNIINSNYTLLSSDDRTFLNETRNIDKKRSFPMELQGMTQGSFKPLVKQIKMNPSKKTQDGGFRKIPEFSSTLIDLHKKINNF